MVLTTRSEHGCYSPARLFSLAVLLASVVMLATASRMTSKAAADEPVDETSEQSEAEAAQVKAAERFLTVLEKAPRRGTALDRVYGHHVEFGTLDQFIAKLKEKTEKTPDDGTSWMLLGLLESQRGQDASAADAFTKAETLRPTDALASYYLGQSLVRIGQNAEAVAAMERAIDRKPQRMDVLEIFQQLGRMHQRAQRNEDALKVWTRLEEMFPDDPRVLEQIAVTLAEEGALEPALTRYERLAKIETDDYRKTMSLVAVAELKVRSGKKEEGLRDLEAVLAELDPEGWLYRDVRRRVDDVFLKIGDQDGLVSYYESWLASHPEDVEGMSRLAKFLAQAARVPEAAKWMEKALKLAPSRADLRKAFIDQLVDDQRIPEALQQYSLLVEAAPANTDFLRDWGKLVLKDKSQDLEVRKKEATRIWNLMLASKGDDPLMVSQVADLFRQSDMKEEALALYEKAVTLAPADPQYREYLGEFYHILKRKDDALATWASIAEGSNRTVENLVRLAEVYNSFGYQDQALATIAEACVLEPKEYGLQMRSAEYHMRAAKYDDALRYVDAAQPLAETEEDRDELIRQRIEILQSSEKLDEEIAAIEKRLEASPEKTAGDWTLLARYYEAGRRWVQAQQSIDAALAVDAKSVSALTAAARIGESSGDYGRAAGYSQQLAEIDRRSRGDHLMNVARLMSQMGKSDEALKAANELIISAPGNTDNYEFYAQLCFRLGKSDEGLEALRKAARINPNEPQLMMALASALATQMRTTEAIEVYWRAFEKSDGIEDRTTLTEKLTPLYLQLNQFEQLIERFERDRREEDKRREMTICLAQAHQTAGDLTTARQELEQLLSGNTRDTNLLQQLSKLCEASGDVDAAINYQRQLVTIAPGQESEFPLVKLLQARGSSDEAMEILIRLTAREEDPARLLRNIDSLLNQGAFEAVIRITEPLLSQQREDWELLYREGLAWAKLNKPEEATIRFNRILDLSIPFDTLGIYAEDRFKRDLAKAKSENLKGNQTAGPQKITPIRMTSYSSLVMRATGLRNEDYYSSSSQALQVWTPGEFGTARMACIGWLMKFESMSQQGTSSETTAATSTATSTTENLTESAATTADAKPKQGVLERFAAAGQAPNASDDRVFDWIFAASLKQDLPSIFQATRQLAKKGTREYQQYFLSSLSNRNLRTANRQRSGEDGKSEETPLDEEDLALMMHCYTELLKRDKNGEMVPAGDIVYSSDGTAYVNIGGRYVLLDGPAGGRGSLMSVVKELRLAGKTEEADRLFAEFVAAIKTPSEQSFLIAQRLQEDKLEELPVMFDKLCTMISADLDVPGNPKNGAISVSRGATSVLIGVGMQWIGRLGEAEENARIVEFVDRSLDLLSRDCKRQLDLLNKASQQQRQQAQQNYGQIGLSWYYGKQSQYVEIEFPVPGRWMSYASLQLLRQTYEVFQRNEVVPDLVALLRKRVEKAPPEHLPFEQMHLASVLWWSGEQDDAVELIAAVLSQDKAELSSQFELVALRQQQGDFDEALTLLDSIAARDQKTLVNRELQALNLAERVADYDRARTAAERLFGLRLDAQTQTGLSVSLRRLGMNDLADAVLRRSERQAGNQPASLASLMLLYQGQGQTEKASQLARMLLQRTKSPISLNAPIVSRGQMRASGDSNRTQAILLLRQTGELKSLIEKLEAQRERNPDNSRIVEQLIEFYSNSAQKDKVIPLLEAAIRQHPDSASLHLQLAKEYQQSNKAKEACDQYLVVMERSPNVIFSDFYEIRNLFRTANRNEDILKVLKKVDLKSISQPYYVVDLVGDMLNETNAGDITFELAEKIFEQLPHYRSNMLSSINSAEIWKSDRFFRLGLQMLIPTDAELKSQPWSGFEVYSYSQGGRVNSRIEGLLSSLRESPRYGEVRKAIEDRVQKAPEWFGGRAILASLDFHSGKREEGLKQFLALANDPMVRKSMTSDAERMVGQELLAAASGNESAGIAGNNDPKTLETALELLVRSYQSTQSNEEFEYTPGFLLIEAYIKLGRKDDARKLLQTALSQRSSGSQADYDAYKKVNNAVQVAQQLTRLQLHVDALKVYSGLMSDEATLRLADSWNGRTDYYLNIAQNGLTESLKQLQGAEAKDAIGTLLTDRKAVSNADQKSNGIDTVLDVMPFIPSTVMASISSSPQDSDSDSEDAVKRSGIHCGLVSLLTKLSEDPQIQSAIHSRLQELADKYPADTSVALVRAGMLVHSKDPGANSAVDTLLKLLEAHPLEEVAPGRRPNSRQRKEAAPDILLWIIAKPVLASDPASASGTALATRALQAAERQDSLAPASQILMGWSQILLEAGNRPEAESQLRRLLEISTVRPKRKAAAQPPGGPRPVPGRPVPQAVPVRDGSAGGEPPAELRNDALPLRLKSMIAMVSLASVMCADPASAACAALPVSVLSFQEGAVVPQRAASENVGDTEKKAEIIPPLTISQFRLAMRVALVAAENDMVDLSIAAIREALAGGSPLPDPVVNRANGMAGRMSSSPSGEDQSQFDEQVASSLKMVIAKWDGDQYPASEVYDLLTRLVFPASRPADILLFPDYSGLRDASPESIASTLVTWTIRAGRQDELRKLLNDRSQSGSVIKSSVVHVLLDLELKQTSGTADRLKSIKDLLSQSPDPESIRLACLAAIPSASDPQLKPEAMPILKLAMMTPGANGQSENLGLGELDRLVTEWLAEANDLAALQQHFDAVLAANQANYARYSGDYGSYMQWNALANVASQASRVKAIDIALDYMGRTVDLRVDDYQLPRLETPLAIVVRHFRAMDSQKRYEAWRDWTMPKEGRQTVRLVCHSIPAVPQVPGLDKTKVVQALDGSAILCNLTELVQSAKEANCLSDLEGLAKKAYDEKLPNADYLWMILQLEKENREFLTTAYPNFLKSLSERRKGINDEGPFCDFLIVYKCLQSNALNEIALNFGFHETRKLFQDNGGSSMLSHLHREFGARFASRTGSTLFSAPPSFVQATPQEVQSFEFDDVTNRWLSDGKAIYHFGGVYQNALWLNWPIEGDFEFSVDCLENYWGECDTGYGGLFVTTNGWSDTRISNFTGGDEVSLPRVARRGVPSFNRVTIQSKEGVVRFLSNNNVVYEEKLTGAAPWLALFTEGSKLSVYRNAVLSGSPRIPKQVNLLAGDSLIGWVAAGQGTTPKPRLLSQKVTDPDSSLSYYQREARQPASWNVQNGVLEAKGVALPKPERIRTISGLTYERPLLEGETISWEAWLDQDKFGASPALGQLAFMMTTQGVKSVSRTYSSFDANVLGLKPGLPVSATSEESGSGSNSDTLPVRNAEWNRITLSRNNGRVIVTLNDVVVHDEEVPKLTTFHPGICRFVDQSVRIRNITLTGSWPSEVTEDMKTSLFHLTTPMTAQDRSVINKMLPEVYFREQITSMMEACRSIEPQEAYLLLHGWVLPNEEHDDYRLGFRLASYSPENDLAQKTSDDLHSPALELVRVAKQANQLEALHQDLQQRTANDPQGQRDLAALRFLVAVEKGDMTAAETMLKNILEVFGKGLPKSISSQHRAAELLVVWKGMEVPSLLPAITDLATRIRDAERTEERSDSELFSKIAHSLPGRIAILSAPATPTSASAQWVQVPYLKPDQRYHGYRTSEWKIENATATHVPAETWSQLWFQSPLTGKFEITADRSTFGWGECVISYGMFSAEPRYDAKAVRTIRLMHSATEIETAPKLPEWKNMAAFRIVVDGRRLTTFTNGVQIHDAAFNAAPSPWIVLQADQPGNECRITNLRITGTPEIPDEIDLIDMADWNCWRADIFEESHSFSNEPNSPWRKSGNEIVAKALPEGARTRQSLLHYQRPMLEDGVIEFETFWEPGVTEVHPCVGRSVVMISSDGAKLHQLTEAQYESRELAIDNESPIAGAAVPELKLKDWNRVRLSLKGDQLTVSVNEKDIATVTISEPPSERFFGLFHYSNKTASRVRNLKYRGEWPKTLPAIAEQVLAKPDGQ
ncbi:MAG: DUF1583 domain-containing protein [Planctomycetaceae bacterium]|nr:DUF1583 domain-containing protein [Planctomycetaceae bacterium]